MRNTSARRRLSLSASVLAICAMTVPTMASAAACVWTGGPGSWNTAGDWSCGVVPGSADDVSILVAGSVVALAGVSDNAGTIVLGAGNQLNVSGSNLTIFGGAVTNDGTVTVAANSRFDNGSGPLSISGTGAIVLDDTSGFAFLFQNGGIMTLGAGQTVRGSGNIGLNNPVIVSDGLISANVSGRGIDIDVAGGNGGVGGGGVGTGNNAALLNTSTMQATGGGTLSFEGGLYENSAGGLIKADAGSIVSLNGDSRILNGTLQSVGTGRINAHGTNQYLTSVTLASGSHIDVSGDNLLLNTSLVNNGTITVGGNARLDSEGSGALTISGTGTIVLDNSAGFAHLFENGGIMTLGSNQTITGSGDIGLNNPIIINNHLFTFNSGSHISIDVAGGNGGVGGGVGADNTAAFLNNGTVSADGFSTVSLEGGQYDNRPGTIAVTNHSTLNLDADSRIVGGTLSSDATSVINAHGTTQYLTNVTLTPGSHIDVNSDNLLLNTSLVNNGTITVGGNARLDSEGSGALTISGTGTIVLDNSAGFAHLFENGGIMTLGSNQTITGSGDIGLNNPIIINNHLFTFNSGSHISIDVAGGNGGVGGGVGADNTAAFLNNGTVSADGFSTVSLEGGQYDNRPGTIAVTNHSTLNLDADSRIVGGTLSSDATSVINAHGTTQYLSSATLTPGSHIDVNSDNLLLNASLVNNGTITVGVNSRLDSEGSGNLTISGAGFIALDDTAGFAFLFQNGGIMTLNADQTVRGSGNIGLNNPVIVNNGVISADVSARGISIDVAGGNGGVGPGGVGTANNSAFLNTGTLQAAGGGILALEGGLYENSTTGMMVANTGSTVVMNGDASLFNLQAGGVLNKGYYISSTTGAASTLDLRSNAANSIATIGSGSLGADTFVTLDGANSVINVLTFGGGVPVSLDSTLTTVNRSGFLMVLGDRNLTIVAGGGAFTNAGQVQLGGGTFGAASYANNGPTTGFGTIAVDISNTGNVRASGGILATQTITGAAGFIGSDGGAILDLSAASADSTAGTLNIAGGLGLGAHNVTITDNYANGGFGLGNAFNNHANVTGTGKIFALNATMDLSGPTLSGTTIDVGSVRSGGSSSTTLTITNNGTVTNIVGAVQNTGAPSVVLTGADFFAFHGGGHAAVGLSFTGTHAGSLAGQTLKVVNNFDNLPAQTLNVKGTVYEVAQAGALPASVTLAATRVGAAASTSVLTIANVAPVTPGFNETLDATASASSPFKVNGSASATLSGIAAGSSAPLTLSLATGVAGSYSDTVSIANTSIPVAGSGLAPLGLAGQSVAVSGNVYAPAVANLSGHSIDFGAVRQGAGSPSASLGLTNGALGSLADVLVTTASGLPTGVTAVAPAPLAAGQSGSVGFSLSTATAGVVGGSGTLDFTSHDPELADLSLASQSVNFTGTVTQLAVALLSEHSGPGTFAGSGHSYTLDLGSYAAGTGTSADIGVTNGIPNSAFSEFLGGAFTHSTASGFSFAGNTFSGLAGGSENFGNLLGFNSTGLSAGSYSELITFNGFSRFPGLSDFSFGPITLDVTAVVTGGAGGVPEPATWAMMLVGFGLVGAATRQGAAAQRRRRAA